jgi:hypothetical protein
MKIYDTSQQTSAAATNTLETQRLEPSGAKVSVTGPRKGERPDEVKLSTVGSQLAADAAGPEREAHLARLNALYQSGTYHVEADAVSQRVVDDSIFAR